MAQFEPMSWEAESAGGGQEEWEASFPRKEDLLGVVCQGLSSCLEQLLCSPELCSHVKITKK